MAIHPIKYEIIIQINAVGEASPKQLADLTPFSLNNVAYHVRQLERAGVLIETRTEPARGVVQHFFQISPACEDD